MKAGVRWEKRHPKLHPDSHQKLARVLRPFRNGKMCQFQEAYLGMRTAFLSSRWPCANLAAPAQASRSQPMSCSTPPHRLLPRAAQCSRALGYASNKRSLAAMAGLPPIEGRDK